MVPGRVPLRLERFVVLFAYAQATLYQNFPVFNAQITLPAARPGRRVGGPARATAAIIQTFVNTAPGVVSSLTRVQGARSDRITWMTDPVHRAPRWPAMSSYAALQAEGVLEANTARNNILLLC